jgi:hypothetical protein
MPHQENCQCPICQQRLSGLPTVQMTIRIAPDIKQLILGNPKGARAYLEDLVNDALMHQGRLAAEKFILMQERQAHKALQKNQSKLLEQQKIYQDALRQIAAMSPGPLSQLAEQALFDANQISKTQP